MTKETTIVHAIPQIGLESITLFSPADDAYAWLKDNKEISRLNKLRHLGVLSHALPGTRQARWDYTMAMLYYASRFEVRGSNSKFKIDDVEFSSAIAALQLLALFWNIGHLPGVFAVEKGVYRFLTKTRPNDPVQALPWPSNPEFDVDRLKSAAAAALDQSDYLALARVLGIVKLLGFPSKGKSSKIVDGIVAPFSLNYQPQNRHQWRKLNTAFKIIRHFAYLTLDSPISGLRWAPNIPALFDQLVGEYSHSIDELDVAVCEILSPVERMTYGNVYHSVNARYEVAVVSAHVEKHLSSKSDPGKEISRWLKQGLYQNLRIGRVSRSSISLATSVRLRSHFSSIPESPVRLESQLQKKGFSNSVVFEYRAWNSDVLLEPDELIIDAFVSGKSTTKHIGVFGLWLINLLEDLSAQADDIFALFRKSEIEPAYRELLSRAVNTMFGDLSVTIEPWPLERYGLLPERPPPRSLGGVWATNGSMSGPIIDHILRDRSRRIDPALRPKYEEMSGIRQLRRHLRVRWGGRIPRQRWLVFTSSVIFSNTNRPLIEFDGGAASISARSGKLTWYGLETKSGRRGALSSLNRRVKILGLPGKTYALGNKFAVLEMPMSP